jgi:hypothetical protein
VSSITTSQHYAEGDFDPDLIVGIEERFKFRIPGTVSYLVGVVDLVVRDPLKSDRFWVVDHKFVTTFTQPDALYLDDQMTTYLWGYGQANNINVVGAIFNQVKKSIPKIPTVLKSGKGMSRADCDTTWEIYQAALIEQGFDPNEYQEMKAKLAPKVFFRRDHVFRTRKELENFTNQIRMEAREMTSKNTPRYPSQTYDCTWRCPFTMLCKCESEGGDVHALARANFIEKGDWNGDSKKKED